jgi:hypothetical protein
MSPSLPWAGTEFWVELEPTDQGTRLRLRSRQLPAWGALAWLLVRLVAAPRVACGLEESLEQVARILGQRPPASRARA